MKDIKFRVWNSKIFVFGPYRDDTNPSWALAFASAIDQEPEQYVGIKDKNGREIFEGDILGSLEENNGNVNKAAANRKRPSVLGVVTFESGSFGVQIDYDMLFFPFAEMVLHDLEVIGNIHENPTMFER